MKNIFPLDFAKSYSELQKNRKAVYVQMFISASWEFVLNI